MLSAAMREKLSRRAVHYDVPEGMQILQTGPGRICFHRN
jgi:hypothetical protein